MEKWRTVDRVDYPHVLSTSSPPLGAPAGGPPGARRGGGGAPPPPPGAAPRGRRPATGRGAREPRADNSNEAGRQINRRVEIFVQPQEA